MEQNVMTMWEAMLATVPATAVGVTVLAIVIVSINKRIDDTNKRMDKGFDDVNRRFDDVNRRFDDVNRRIDDLSLRFDKRIDDLRELLTMIFGDEIRKVKFKKTGSDK